MAKLRHLAIAAKDPDAMAQFYKSAFGFAEVRRTDGPLAYGWHLSDGTIDLAILRFKTDQLGKGLDYQGLHHFGVLVEDVEAAAGKIEASAASTTWTRPRAAPAASRSSSTGPRASSSTSPNTPGPERRRSPATDSVRMFRSAAGTAAVRPSRKPRSAVSKDAACSCSAPFHKL
jgi:extradiol dioxygenase family protein